MASREPGSLPSRPTTRERLHKRESTTLSSFLKDAMEQTPAPKAAGQAQRIKTFLSRSKKDLARNEHQDGKA